MPAERKLTWTEVGQEYERMFEAEIREETARGIAEIEAYLAGLSERGR
jgi:hypothetical protein